MPPTELLTMLHISDLHFGEIDPATGDARYTNPAAWLLSNFTWFDGVLGHHARGVQDLEAFYTGLVVGGQAPLLIVSGDLSRAGNYQEFQTADDFLSYHIDLNPPVGNYVGLYHPKWLHYAIPGNHDHWPGAAVIFGRPTAGLAAYFPPASVPFVRSITLGNGRTLQVIGINTDADVWPHGLKRLRAVGAFQKQLTTVATRLGQEPQDHIRVLLMHHSWDHRGAVLAIDRGSRAALGNFLVAHGIQIVLTGHTHHPLVQKFIPQVQGAQPVLECRCGTTTQHDQVPYHWRTLFGAFPSRRWPHNTLIVHRLTEQNGTTTWHAETFTRTRGRGFVTLGPVGQEHLVV